MSEKTLEAYNDVFADIVNGLLFRGRRLVREEELEDAAPRSVYKADGDLHEQERDVAKRWRSCGVRIAFFGIENQTHPEGYMPVRVIGYDGAAYRSQLLVDRKEGGTAAAAAAAEKERKGAPECYPVVTLVLYFGYDKQWDGPLTLYDCFRVPEEWKPYVNDYRINLFEIAWLTDEQLKLFRSDFKYVADYCVQMRKMRDYRGPSETVAPGKTEPVVHFDELFKLFTAVTGDSRFEEAANEVRREGGARTVCEALDRIEARGEQRGMQKGMRQGKLLGRENALLSAVANLMKNTKWTAGQAMEALGIPAAEQKELMGKL